MKLRKNTFSEGFNIMGDNWDYRAELENEKCNTWDVYNEICHSKLRVLLMLVNFWHLMIRGDMSII